MPFTDIPALPAPPPPGTGISFGLQITRAGRKVRLTIRADLQEQLFGGPIEEKRFNAQVGRGADEGRLRLVMCDDGPLVARKGMRGSAFINMAGWDLLPNDKRPAAPAKIHSTPSNVEVILTLPDYCRPSGRAGKMEAEFGIKRASGART